MLFVMLGPIIIFGLIGIVLLWAAVSDTRKKWRRRRFLVHTTGQVSQIVRGSAVPSATHTRFPVIRFMNQEGTVISFKSSLGYSLPKYSYQTRRIAPPYQIGQNIRVCYDPGGVLPPMIDSWWAHWFLPLSLGVGGALFLVVAWLLWVQSSERILSMVR